MKNFSPFTTIVHNSHSYGTLDTFVHYTHFIELPIYSKQNGSSCQQIALPVTYNVWKQIDSNIWLHASSSNHTAEIIRGNETLNIIQTPHFDQLSVMFHLEDFNMDSLDKLLQL